MNAAEVDKELSRRFGHYIRGFLLDFNVSSWLHISRRILLVPISISLSCFSPINCTLKCMSQHLKLFANTSEVYLYKVE